MVKQNNVRPRYTQNGDKLSLLIVVIFSIHPPIDIGGSLNETTAFYAVLNCFAKRNLDKHPILCRFVELRSIFLRIYPKYANYPY
ncbi:MAG: hypothetical protein ACRCUY_12485 [Thermoguttaceae bacterium]